MNLTEALLHALKDRGATEVFGIPGDFALPYFKVIEESGILPLYTMSHEPALGFAADAAARFRGGLGVAAVTYGAGALNIVNAVAQAYAEKSPVVVISGAPGTTEPGRGLLLHHQAKTIDSQFRMFREITCDQAVLDDPTTAPALIARVLRNCLEHSRPVYLEIPRDMPAAECGPVPAHEPTPVDPEAVDACASEILRRIGSADSPALMVGVEVRRFGLEREVTRLAETLGIPVATSFMGSGLVADAPCLMGTYLGVAGDDALTAVIENSDCLLLLGVILSDTNFGISAKAIDVRRAIHIEDREVRLGFHTYPNIALDALLESLTRQADAAGGFKCVVERPERVYPRGFSADAAPLEPDDVAALYNDFFALHDPMPLAVDIGDCLFTAMGFTPTPLVAPGYYASMGFGVPAGLGLQAATGRRTMIMAGDGAFQMTGWELGNCARYGWNPIVLVFNNASWEMLRAFQPQADYPNIGQWDFAGVADKLGGMGHKVTTRAELKAALENAYADTGRFHLLDIALPKGAISGTLRKFIAGMTRK